MVLKNRRGFTLVETLAVIILLGVILTIAVPSINNVVGRNNRRRLQEAAEMFIVLGKQKIQTDTSIEYPKDDKVVVLYLNSIDIKQLENIVNKNVSFGDSILGKKSKVVFSYNSNKWITKFVALYDMKGNAAYLTSEKVVVGKDDNPTLISLDKYDCDDNGKGYCYYDE